MFTFHWSTFFVVVACSLILFLGVAIMMLRRRDEVLRGFLTPEESDLKEEYFHVRRNTQEEESDETSFENEHDVAANESQDDPIQWGNSTG